MGAMIRRWKLLICLLLFCGQLGICRSQPIEQIDPQGLQHAFNLYEAWTAGNNAQQIQLLTADPNLTKRAFAAGVFYMYEGNVEQSEAFRVLNFLSQLANWINVNQSDQIPAEIVQNFNNGGNDWLPAVSMYRQLLLTGGPSGGPVAAESSSSSSTAKSALDADRYNTAGRATDLGPIAIELLRPLLTKVSRIQLAVAYSDPGLTIQELDTFPDVVRDYAKAGAQVGESTTELVELAERKTEIVNLVAQAELGLVKDFEAASSTLLKQEEDSLIRLNILLTGLRLAQNKQELDEIDDFLAKSSKELNQSELGVNPVVQYVLRTAKFRQKLDRGAQASKGQVAKEFAHAWDALASYKPLERLSHDYAWHFGQGSNRFWIEQLTESGKEGPDGLQRIENDVTSWLNILFSPDHPVNQNNYSSDDWLLRMNDARGFITTLAAFLDVPLYAAEIGSIEESDNKALDFVSQLTESLGSFDKNLGVNLTLPRPGFPPFDLSRSAYIEELRVRIKMLKALSASAPNERGRLLALVLPELKRVVLPENYIDYHLLLGSELHRVKRYEEAVVAWKRALEKSEQLSYVSRAVEASAALAEEYGRREEWQSVSEYAAKANSGMKEEIVASGSEESLAMAKKSQDLVALEAKAHIKANNPEKALQALSEGHQLNNAAAQLSSNKEAAQATVKLKNKKKQVATLAAKVKQLQELPASSTRDELIQKAQKVLADTRQEFLLKSREIRQKFANIYSSSLRFDPLNLPSVQKALPPGAAVVQYFPTEKELYIFLVTDSQFRLRSVALAKEDLNQQVLAYRRRLSVVSSEPTQRLTDLSKNLYASLIGPIEQDLAQSKTVIFIPTGRLNLLPFGALLNGEEEPLLAGKTILELGRTEDLKTIAKTEKKTISKVLALANATLDLPAAELEGKAITKIFPESTLLLKEEANKKNLMQMGSQAEVLHLATHGTWDASNSLNNHLKLANGEKLSQKEIFALNLENTSIVTLSACSTALADTRDVGFVASLAEAFWLAGSRTVVASLWQVDDNSTGLLMTQFYENLSKGQGKAEALRNAQLHVMKQPKYSHPYHWSGFILFGDYR